MDDALLQHLLREKDKRIREKNQEINFLRNALWDATHGIETDLPDPIPTEREGEPTGPMLIDGLCREILEGK